MFREAKKAIAPKLRPHPHPSLRSIGKKTRAAAIRHKHKIQQDDKQPQIKLNDGSKAVLLSRQVTDFTQKLVSIGESPREKLILDVNTPIQKALYARFKQEFLKDEKDPEKIFNLIIQFAKKVCFPKHTEADVDALIAAHKKKDSDELELSIDEFLKAESGICRQYALQISAILSQLHKEKLLQPIRIYHYRTNLKNGGHAWVMVKGAGGIYLLDGLWDEHAYRMSDDLAKDPRLQKYGHDVAQECHERLLGFYSHSKADTSQRRRFLNYLLESEDAEADLADHAHEIKFIIYDLEAMRQDASSNQAKLADLLAKAKKIQAMQPKLDVKEEARSQTLSYTPHTVSPKLKRSPSTIRLDLGDEEKLLVCQVALFAEKLGRGSFGVVRPTDNPNIAVKLMRPSAGKLDEKTGDLLFDARYSKQQVEAAIEASCNLVKLKNEALFNRCINGVGAHCMVDAPIVMKIEEQQWRVTSWPHAYLAMKRLKGIPLSHYKIDSRLKYLHLCEAACAALAAIHAKGVVLEDIHEGNLLVEEYQENGITRIKVHFIDHTITQKEGTEFNLEGLDLDIKPPEFKGVRNIKANKSHDIFCLGKVLNNVLHHNLGALWENRNDDIDREFPILAIMQNRIPEERPCIQKCLEAVKKQGANYTFVAFESMRHRTWHYGMDPGLHIRHRHDYVAALRMCTDAQLKEKVFRTISEEGLKQLNIFLAEYYANDPLVKRLHSIEPRLLHRETQHLRHFLNHIKLTIANGFLKPKPGNCLSKWCSRFFTPGKAIQVNGKEVYVPLRASHMYHKLTTVDINTLELAKLKELLNDIIKLANEAFSDAQDRTRTTSDFYRVLVDNEPGVRKSLSVYELQEKFEKKVVNYNDVIANDHSRFIFEY